MLNGVFLTACPTFEDLHCTDFWDFRSAFKDPYKTRGLHLFELLALFCHYFRAILVLLPCIAECTSMPM